MRLVNKDLLWQIDDMVHMRLFFLIFFLLLVCTACNNESPCEDLEEDVENFESSERFHFGPNPGDG